MADIDDESGPNRSEIEKREQEEKERKAKEDAEQATLPYKWTQTISDADVTVPVPSNVKGRDLDILITKTKIRVGLKGQAPIMDVGCFFFFFSLPWFLLPPPLPGAKREQNLELDILADKLTHRGHTYQTGRLPRSHPRRRIDLDT
jgi:hypothetical protein